MHTVVFDIGKTNKKVYVFDAAYDVIEHAARVFPETDDDDGFPCDDLDALCAWVDDCLAELTGRYPVSRVNFSTYGATLVHVDGHGAPTTPLYNYLKPVDTAFLRSVYGRYGGMRHLHAVLGSPPLGMLNSGWQLAWLREARPSAFAKTRATLHFPQYLAYRLTGELRSEYTSVGCHTALWDFPRGRYHAWTRRDGYAQRLPPVGDAAHASRVVWRGRALEVGVGIHDSSAALLPYLRRYEAPFVLLSTGTWAIAFNPWNRSPLTTYELAHDCLTFMRDDGRAVKASRLFLGREHDVRAAELAEHFGVDPSTYTLTRYRPELDPAGQPARFAWTELAEFVPRGTGRHVDDADYLRAYHRLLRELVDVQLAALDLVVDRDDLRHLVVDGGLARSELLLAMLRLAYPQAVVEASINPIGSALGAALVMQAKAVKHAG